MNLNNRDAPPRHDRAAVFVSDRGFILPTLLAATQVRQQAEGIADVYIVLTGVAEEESALVSDYARAHGIIVRQINGIELDDKVDFAKTHVPPSALGRFYITSVLPQFVKHIVYIDGDVQIVGDITPLLKHSVPEGRIVAANDRFWLGSLSHNSGNAAYLSGLNVTASEYFNSGVMAFRRSTWETFSVKALDFFISNSQLCHYHDQSALNAIFKGARDEMSPNYNFTSAYAILIGIDKTAVRLIHFTGGNKPWYFDGPPWDGRFLPLYQDLISLNPALSVFEQRPSDEKLRQDRKFEHRQRLMHHLLGLTIIRGWKLRRRLKHATFAF